jgi:hypothetical protein
VDDWKAEWLENVPICKKRYKFQLTTPGAELSNQVAIVCPDLQARLTDKRDVSKGEMPWTNMDDNDSEEMSSIAHVAGFLITHTATTVCRRSTCPSRASECFDGWVDEMEPPYGRPQV